MIDHDIQTIQLMRKFGFKGFFGDPTRPDLLRAAGLNEARILVVALDDPASTTKLVAYARKHQPDLHIIARAHDRNHVYSLYAAGANDIVREMFDSSLRAGRYVLENLGMTEFEAAEAADVEAIAAVRFVTCVSRSRSRSANVCASSAASIARSASAAPAPATNAAGLLE